MKQLNSQREMPPISFLPRKPKNVEPQKHRGEILGCLAQLNKCCMPLDRPLFWPDASVLNRLDAAITRLAATRRAKICRPIGRAYRLVDSRWPGLQLGKKITRLLRGALFHLESSKIPYLRHSTFHRIFRTATSEKEDAPLARKFLQRLDQLLKRQVRAKGVEWETFKSLLIPPGKSIVQLEIGDVTLGDRELCYLIVLETIVLEAQRQRRDSIRLSQIGPLIDWVREPGISMLQSAHNIVLKILEYDAFGDAIDWDLGRKLASIQHRRDEARKRQRACRQRKARR